MARLIAGLTLAFSLIALALPATAQQTEQDRRLDRLEKQMKELRSIVFQGRDTGQPVVVKPDGPDPAVQALQSRVDDMDQTVRRQSGQVEVIQHDLDLTRTNAASGHDGVIELRAQIQALSDRLNRLENPPAPPQPAMVAPQPDPQPTPKTRKGGRAALDATARAQAEDQGVLGGPPVADDGAVSEPGAYKHALALQEAGDYANAGAAWQDYIAHYGQGARGREARYRLGETLYIQSAYGEAARAYAEALRGWPKTGWAPDATVKLSQSLVQLGRRDEACSVIGEFDNRYGAVAGLSVKNRAKSVRAKAACAG